MLLCCHFKEPPDAGAIFPLLREMEKDDVEEEVDDDSVFRSVTSSLMLYQNE